MQSFRVLYFWVTQLWFSSRTCDVHRAMESVSSSVQRACSRVAVIEKCSKVTIEAPCGPCIQFSLSITPRQLPSRPVHWLHKCTEAILS